MLAYEDMKIAFWETKSSKKPENEEFVNKVLQNMEDALRDTYQPHFPDFFVNNEIPEFNNFKKTFLAWLDTNPNFIKGIRDLLNFEILTYQHSLRVMFLFDYFLNLAEITCDKEHANAFYTGLLTASSFHDIGKTHLDHATRTFLKSKKTKEEISNPDQLNALSREISKHPCLSSIWIDNNCENALAVCISEAHHKFGPGPEINSVNDKRDEKSERRNDDERRKYKEITYKTKLFERRAESRRYLQRRKSDDWRTIYVVEEEFNLPRSTIERLVEIFSMVDYFDACFGGRSYQPKETSKTEIIERVKDFYEGEILVFESFLTALQSPSQACA